VIKKTAFEVKFRQMKINKRYRKPRVQSRIENLHTLASLGTQDTGGRQTKQKQNITQKPIKMITKDPK
jgi:hypothetical protein